MIDVAKLIEHDPGWKPHIDMVLYPPEPDECLSDYPELASSDAMRGIMYPSGVPRVAMYYRARREGSSHRMAELFACQRSPALMTDSVFFSGLQTVAQMDPGRRRDILKGAKQHGFTPGQYDIYQSGLARFPGDPEAFVPPTGGRNHIRRICEKRGWACEGAVEVQAQTPDRDPLEGSKPLADDIIQSYMRKELKERPLADRKALREKIIAEHGMS